MKALFVFLLFFANYSFTFAQEDKKSNEEYSSEIKVYFLNSYGAIYQYKYSEKSSVRFQLDIIGNLLDSDRELSGLSKYVNGNIINSNSTRDETTNSYSILISPQYCYSLYQIKNFNFYIGTAPALTYSFSSYESNDKSKSVISVNETTELNSKNKSRTWSLGFMGFLGIEGNINENLKIFSEIYISENRKWNTIENETNQILENKQYFHQTSNYEVNSWGFSISNVTLGVSYSF